MTDPDAIFAGEPRDGAVFAGPDSGLIEVPDDGLTRRYLLTAIESQRSWRPSDAARFPGPVA